MSRMNLQTQDLGDRAVLVIGGEGASRTVAITHLGVSVTISRQFTADFEDEEGNEQFMPGIYVHIDAVDTETHVVLNDADMIEQPW